MKACTIIGVGIEEGCLYRKVKTTCPCLPSTRGRGVYCSNCGVIKESTRVVPIGNDGSDGNPVWGPDGSFFTFPDGEVMQMYQTPSESSMFFFGWCQETGADGSYPIVKGYPDQIKDLIGFQKSLRDKFLPLGLWEDMTFGIWTLLLY